MNNPLEASTKFTFSRWCIVRQIHTGEWVFCDWAVDKPDEPDVYTSQQQAYDEALSMMTAEGEDYNESIHVVPCYEHQNELRNKRTVSVAWQNITVRHESVLNPELENNAKGK